MNHLNDGQITAYLDRALPQAEYRAAQAHIAECETCAARLEALNAQRARVSTALHNLAPRHTPDSRRALARIQQTIKSREDRSMGEKIFADKTIRRVLAGAAALVVLVGLFSLAPVRALARDFLGLFRVEEFAVIGVDPERLEQIAGALDENMLFGEEQMLNAPSEPVTVSSLAEAEQMAGFAPGVIGEPDVIMVTDSVEVRFTPDVEAMRAAFETLGLDPELLPASIDGQPFDFRLSAGVMQVYNDGDPDMYRDYNIMQAPSPTVDVPDEVDMQALGTALLQFLGMSEREAARLSQNIDWATTLVLPVPTDVAEVREVSINGQSGLLFVASQQTGPDRNESAVLWQEGGIVTLVVSNAGPDALLQTARNMQ